MCFRSISYLGCSFILIKCKDAFLQSSAVVLKGLRSGIVLDKVRKYGFIYETSPKSPEGGDSFNITSKEGRSPCLRAFSSLGDSRRKAREK